MGLKLGIYNDLGNMTCAGYLGSFNYLRLDAQVRIAKHMDTTSSMYFDSIHVGMMCCACLQPYCY